MPCASIVYCALADSPALMICAISVQMPMPSSRGVHDNGCGNVTVPSVPLCATTASAAVLPEPTVNVGGAVHVSEAAPYCLGGAGIVGGGAMFAAAVCGVT